MKIYLASQSPRRQELLRQIDVVFDVVPHGVNERRRTGESAGDYALRMAQEKARGAVALARGRGLPPRPVLGADTVVSLQGEIFGKPQDEADARRMLRRLSGNTHEVLTAVALAAFGEDPPAGAPAPVLVATRVTFDPLGEDEIEGYLRAKEAGDKAGGYAIQGRAARFIARIEGSYSAVVGLPLREVARLLGAVTPVRA
ncbi:MAG: Maf family protein [Acidiferrobacteraceae bacterium]